MGHKNFGRNDPRFWGECELRPKREASLERTASLERADEDRSD